MRATGASCVLSFANPEKVPIGIVVTLLGTIVEWIVQYSKRGECSSKCSRRIIEAISVVAKVSGEAFGAFYDGFMPAAKGIIKSATAAEYQELRGKTMDCVGLIGIAVGKEKFLPDAKEVLEMMLTVQATSNSSTDTALDYIVPACARICRAIGEDFLPYLQYIMPVLLERAMSKTDCQITDILDKDAVLDAGGEQTDNGITSTVLDIKGVGSKRVTLNTNDVFEKEIAIRALYDYLDVLEHNMGHFIEAITKAVVPLIVYRYAPAIRNVASLMMPKLIHAACVALRKNFNSCQ